MTARQAETILMLSDFGKRPSGDSKHCEDRENQRLMSCVKTLCSNLQCLFTMAKGAAGVPSMISTYMSIGYGHACDEHNGSIPKYQSLF
jgi:hypothetical protein